MILLLRFGSLPFVTTVTANKKQRNIKTGAELKIVLIKLNLLRF